MEIVIIAAVARNGVIGKDGSIPWRCAEDMRRFRRLTTTHGCGDRGDCVIMGRRTYESIGKPLPKRNNVVVSTTLADLPSLHEPDAHAYVRGSLRDALLLAQSCETKTAWICGGSRLYEEALPFATALELTYVDGTYDGDTFFPYWPAVYDIPYPWRAVGGSTMAARTDDGNFVHFVRCERIEFDEQVRRQTAEWLKERA